MFDIFKFDMDPDPNVESSHAQLRLTSTNVVSDVGRSVLVPTV
jgi:hypothetical protein